MAFVFGGGLIVAGAVIIGLAYHNQIGAAWKTLIG